MCVCVSYIVNHNIWTFFNSFLAKIYLLHFLPCCCCFKHVHQKNDGPQCLQCLWGLWGLWELLDVTTRSFFCVSASRRQPRTWTRTLCGGPAGHQTSLRMSTWCLHPFTQGEDLRNLIEQGEKLLENKMEDMQQILSSVLKHLFCPRPLTLWHLA